MLVDAFKNLNLGQVNNNDEGGGRVARLIPPHSNSCGLFIFRTYRYWNQLIICEGCLLLGWPFCPSLANM